MEDSAWLVLVEQATPVFIINTGYSNDKWKYNKWIRVKKTINYADTMINLAFLSRKKIFINQLNISKLVCLQTTEY